MSNGQLFLVALIGTVAAVALAPLLRSFGAPVPSMF
jgi:hypothetical protein